MTVAVIRQRQSGENSAFLVIDNLLIDNTLNVVMCQFDLNGLPLAVLPQRSVCPHSR